MKLILLVLVGCCGGLVTSSENDAGFIVGGEDAFIENYPYMAGIMNLGLFNCGGSIINSRSVLTAAHCILIRSATTVSVFVGSSRRRGQGGTTHRALRVSIHPNYIYTPDPFQMQADIAVVRTVRQILFDAFVQPIPLGTEFVPALVPVVLTGWGLLGDVSFWRNHEHWTLLKWIKCSRKLLIELTNSRS